jgi:predicted dehydrogenase
MRSLIVGLGIGQLYKSVLEQLGHEIVTVDTDISKGATFPSVDPAIILYKNFDCVFICTPNFTHFDIASKVAKFSKIVFIEKPGVSDSTQWKNLTETFPKTRFMMIKNNMWRSNINDLKELADKARFVRINWINQDRVPNPGTWFTTKELAFGGVSRDLMPHLLSLFVSLDPYWSSEIITGFSTRRRYELKELTNTDYGRVKADGVYDVDDFCHISFGDKWSLIADWRSLTQDQRNIEFFMPDDTKETFELGLCPEEAYKNMIVDAIANLNTVSYWKQQSTIDMWIHEKVEKL